MSKVDFDPYYAFLAACRKKNYEGEPIHEHHITPDFLWDLAGRTEPNTEVIHLSVDDHIKAHQILAKCYPEGSEERLGNLHSVKLLSKSDPSFRKELAELYESMKGEGNWAKKPEVRKKISEGLKKFYKNNDNATKGKKYEQIYGPEKAKAQKEKRKKATRSPAEYKRSAAKTAKKLKGQPAPNRQKVLMNGEVFESQKAAADFAGVSEKTMRLWLNGRKPKQHKYRNITVERIAIKQQNN